MFQTQAKGPVQYPHKAYVLGLTVSSVIGYYRPARPAWKQMPNVLLDSYPSDVLRTREMASRMPLCQSKLPSYSV